MSTRNGLYIEKRRMRSGKAWMLIRTTKDDGAAPSFEDWFVMIKFLCECEVEKYADTYGMDPMDPVVWSRFTKMPRSFIDRCFDKDSSYEQLRDEFRLPR